MPLSLQSEYRSSGLGVVENFFAQVLPASTSYKRAVGFFASSVFNVAREAWSTFFQNGGVMWLVCSEQFSAGDLAALQEGVADRPRWRRRQLADLLSLDQDTRCRSILAWLVANDRLIIKIAFLKHARPNSMYHEKVGIFEDTDNAAVAISGSANETENAWRHNFERVDTFVSWGGMEESTRCSSIRSAFDSLWNNTTPGVEVKSLVDCLLGGLLTDSGMEEAKVALQGVGDSAAPGRSIVPPPEVLVPPPEISLFQHQKLALKAWGEAGGRGLLEMATGAGKTITALHLASRLYEAAGPGMLILIVAPFIHLADQWIEVARRYGLRPIRCAESMAGWHSELGAAIDALNAGRRGILSVATTAATLTNPAFGAQISRSRRAFLLIGDEAHNYGSPEIHKALPRNAQYRVGLSATPTRWMDAEGTARLESYFGPVVFQYGLRDAIRDKVLTPYRYYPDLVPFSDDEFENYIELSNLIKRYCRREQDDVLGVSEAAKTLLIKRARLIASARGKVPRLYAMLEKRRGDDHILVYCGDGSMEGPNGDELIRQVDAVTSMLGNELGMRCASYTARTSATRRKELIEEFDSGFIQVLVAIRCLDEGVDIPSTRTAFILASSTNPRQFVQRRGRVLRRHSFKSRAEIHDFFVTPPADAMVKGASGYEDARSLVRSQVHRAAEFASLAENGPIARGILVDLMSPLHLLDIWERS